MLTRNGKRTNDLVSDTTHSSAGPNTNDSVDPLPPPAKKPCRTPARILDGTFYTIIKNDKGKLDAKCLECNKNIKGHTGSTGNFLNHYRTSHPALVIKLDEYLKQKLDGLVQTTLLQKTIERIPPPLPKEQASKCLIRYLNIYMF